ncbi:mediator of RNA polymerase II transcription subunit 1 [Neocloeon triangulifer]|uniref:mediator of RNA polymerase II transcription subunit 1 n=1 Tax=Neocloeon triangulifer TaxID=2078957 RepID=UPI00286EBB26|nr:mediator of RNA polymerase II transcription subunit 1 [Neocloeon triangulifer]
MMAAPLAGKAEAAKVPLPKPPVPAGTSAGTAGAGHAKKWQMEMLMEKLRSKTSQYKSFTDSAKSLKLCLLDKRYPMDLMERQQLQKCLDTLQHSFKVTSLQSMVERLGSVTRQLELKFMAGLSGTDWFISSDMFYLEVVLEQSGCVKDVKIHHEGKVEQQSCEELVNCLARGDFADFAKQLENLAAIYQINADKKQKGKVFQALQSLETDLMNLAEIQSFIKEPHNLIHKSPVGILENRKGGHPMRLTFFVSPYDLLDEKLKTSIPMTVENVISKRLGLSVEVCNEASAQFIHYKLPTNPLITITASSSGKRSPVYASLGPQNSASLPATFVLRLCKPIAMCTSLVKGLQQITEVETGDVNTQHPMLSLITKNCSSGALDSANNKGLFVTLPDQQHCYFLTESKGINAIMMQNIPFTHPTHVPQILSLLRQQALFNTLVESCVRPTSKQEFNDLIIFEVSALSNQQLSVSFEHPFEEAMATVELDLSDICNVRCRLYGPITDDQGMADYASKVVQRSLSIPITMRALIQKWQHQAVEPTNSNFGLSLGNFNTDSMQSKLLPDFECKPVPRPSESSGGGSHSHMMGHLGYQASLNTSPEQFFPSQITVEPIVGQPKTSPLLLNMMGDQKAKKRRRSKVGDAGWTGRSPKRKLSTEEDASQDTQGSYDSMGVAPAEAMDFLEDALVDSNVESFVFEDESQASDSNDELRRKLKRARLESRKNSASSTDSKNSSDNHQAFEITLEGKSSLVGPSVSITPISTPTEPPISSVLGNVGLDKRSGIEIIPLSSGTPSLPSSITITPIKTEERSKDRSRDEKSSKNRDKRPDEKRSEKKKKRHRDEEGSFEAGKLMGPPQAPSKDKSKSESKSPKPLTSPSTSPPLQRKYPNSPTSHLSPGANNPQISLVKTPTSPTQKSKSHSSSPKHSGTGSSSSSPIYGSPKHSAVSPKHSTPSPKSSSGKPSMSALKGTLSKSNSSGSSSSSDPNRVKKDKDKKSSSLSNSSSSPKSKSLSSSSSLSSKVKQDFGLSGGDSPLPAGQPPMTPAQKVVASLLDLEPAVVMSTHKQGTLASDYTAGSPPLQSAPGAASLPATSAQDPQCSTKCPLQGRSRKGSLSAVIDKLKSAQTSPPPDAERRDSDKPKSSSSQKSSTDNKNGLKNSEYMVKSSSEGIKITINKTKKDSKSSSKSSSLPSSPKHTGLKPGVISGPASKKPLHKSNSSSSSSSNRTSSPSSKSKGSLSPSTSKSSLSKQSSTNSPKSSSSSSSSSDKQRTKDKIKDRHSSPSTHREDADSERAFKILAAQAKLEIEMPKLDTKFQIPKLSRSESKEDKKSTEKEKLLEPKVELKKLEDREKPRSFSPLPLNNLKMVPVVALPMLPCTDVPVKVVPEKEPEKQVEAEIPDLGHLSPPKLPIETPRDCDSDDSSPGLLIDFSVDKKGLKGSPPPPPLPPLLIPVQKSPLPVHLPPVLSPSVSVHIVKSPAPSPIILPSPHSSQPSPCITDDELMDEALIGLGK